MTTSQTHEDSVPSVELLPKVARVFRLILKGSTCTRCVSATLGPPRDLLEQALGAIGRAFQLVRPAPQSCALCGSPDDVVAPKTITSLP